MTLHFEYRNQLLELSRGFEMWMNADYDGRVVW